MTNFHPKTSTSSPSRVAVDKFVRVDVVFWCTLIILGSFGASVSAQESPYPIALSTPQIRSVQLHPIGVDIAPAFAPLNGGRLELAFDDFSPNQRQLEIRWKHCTFDWFDSPDLDPADYISGFTTGSFETIDASFNTKAAYTHYRSSFPNDLMQFTLSGNYIVEVYDVDQPEIPLIQRRFTLYETEVSVEARALESTMIRDKRTHQEIDFTVKHGESSYPLYDAYDALQCVILQNGRWESAIGGIEPQFVRGSEVVFNPTDHQSFPGGNSWRFADLKSLQFAALGIEKITEGGAFWHVYLEEDEPRTFDFHQARRDIDGQFTIANDRQENTTGSDYVQVHFRLNAFEPLPGKDIYIFGGISAWDFKPTHRLIWNETNRQYEATLLLKQGYYNYLYLTRDASALGKSDPKSLEKYPGDVEDLEGSHSRADNVYQVIAYYWDISGYDRVIGFQPIRFGVNP